jgi:NitT/TauT family transport system substrate-binding protein
MKKVLRIVLLLIATLTITACTKEAKDVTAPTQTPTQAPSQAPDAALTTDVAPTTEAVNEMVPSGHELTIGILPAESAIPIILAKEKGFFEEAKVDVTIQAFSSPNDRNVAVQAKELDAVIGDVMTCAAFVDKGLAMKITSDISEDFKILSSPGSGITKMEDLSGKKISLVPNFILEYIMDEFAAEYGFSYEIVEIPSFSGRAEALMSNQIDGVLFTEPQAGMLVEKGAHLLGSSKEAGIKGGTLQFTEEMLTNYAGDIKAFYQAYNKAVDYMNSTDVAEYSSILTNYQFPDAIGNYLTGMIGEFQYAGMIDQDRFDKIITWTKDKGMISRIYTYEELTDFTFLE